MKAEQIYEKFGQMLEDGAFKENGRIVYTDFCRANGVNPDELDRYVFSQVGMSVEDVIKTYCRTSSSD